MISPTWRMIHQKKMDHFRPIRSVNGPARRAPIKVPMESWKALAFLTFISVFFFFLFFFPFFKDMQRYPLTMETINPDRTLLKLYVPSGFSCANRCLKLCISKKPEIWPVSYPKMIPPIETKAPSNTDLQVTHGTRDSSMVLPLFSRSMIADSPDKSVSGGDLVPVPPPLSLLRNGIFILEMGDWSCIQYVEYTVSCVIPDLGWLGERGFSVKEVRKIGLCPRLACTL